MLAMAAIWDRGGEEGEEEGAEVRRARRGAVQVWWVWRGSRQAPPWMYLLWYVC
jgi:hypothetical protein